MCQTNHYKICQCHAPRERVSWNHYIITSLLPQSQSRSTWACELKYHLAIPQCWATESRSTWACELKLQVQIPLIPQKRHAPRERVSWNGLSCLQFCLQFRHAPRERVSWNLRCRPNHLLSRVTLHVSVWVEMIEVGMFIWYESVTLHVSVWVEIVSLNPE